MPATPVRRMSRGRVRSFLCRSAVVTVAAAVTAPLVSVSSAHATSAVPVSPVTVRVASDVVVSPGDDLQLAMSNLRAGDTLELQSGVYRTGLIRPVVHPGTATRPITIKAADPAHTPLILGEMLLTNADYWYVSGLRLQAVDHARASLAMWGGSHWKINNSEMFGARQTTSLANVVIRNSPAGPPRGFVFSGNCVHDAAIADPGMDHNMYVQFQGNNSAGGIIERNIIFGHPQGSGIKLGDGGVYAAPGPWHVMVRYNTIGRGGRQILLHGDVRNNSIRSNLFVYSTMPFTRSPKTTAMYMHDIVGRNNAYSNNYIFRASMVAFDPKKTVADLGGNGLRPDPLLTGLSSCVGWRTHLAAAAAYGRYGTGTLPRW